MYHKVLKSSVYNNVYKIEVFTVLYYKTSRNVTEPIIPWNLPLTICTMTLFPAIQVTDATSCNKLNKVRP